MSTGPWGRVVQQIRRAVGWEESDAEDADLLRRWVVSGDQQAFAALVRRHASLVRGVCERIVGDAHHAEDAFQAVFLVLARKASSVRTPDRLGSWLHGVACRVSRKARVAMSRQRVRPGPVEDVPAPAAAADWQDLRPVLDEVVDGLPERYRSPVILCYLEGKTNAEAARQLHCPDGTVASRLARGRDLLRSRLERRGVTLSTVGLAALLAGNASATPVSAASVEAAIQAGLAFAAGTGEGTAVSLAQGAIHTMWLSKIKLMGMVAAALVCLAAGAGFLGTRWHEQASADTKLPSAPEAPPEAKRDRYGDPLPPGAVLRLGTSRLRSRSGMMVLADNASVMVGVENVSEQTVEGPRESSRVQVHDLTTGKELRTWELPGPGWVRVVQLSADGKRLLAGGTLNDEKGIPLWDVETGRILRRFGGQTRGLGGAALSPDGNLVAVVPGFGDPVEIVEAASGKLVGKVKAKLENGLRDARFSADGQVLLLIDNDANITAYDTKTGEHLAQCGGKRWAGSYMVAVAVSPDGRQLALISENPEREGIDLFDLKEKKVTSTLPTAKTQGTRSAVYSPDGKWLAAYGVDGTTRVWDLAQKKVVHSRLGGLPVKFLDGGKVLVVSNGMTLRRWVLATDECIDPFPGHTLGVSLLAGLPEGRILTVGGESVVWDGATGREQRREPPENWPGILAVSADGRLAAGSREPSCLRVWELATGKEVLKVPTAGYVGEAAAFSPDGRTLFLAQHEVGLRCVELQTDKILCTMEGVRGSINSVAVSADGQRVAIGTRRQFGRRFPREPGDRPREPEPLEEPGRVLVWDLAGDKKPRIVGENPAGILQVAFTPDGYSILGLGIQTLESKALPAEGRLVPLDVQRLDSPVEKPKRLGDFKVHLWEVATGKERLSFGDGDLHYYRFALSPDGHTLAAAGLGTAIHLYDMTDGKRLAELGSKELDVLSLAFTPDGRHLLSGQLDTTALVWELPASVSVAVAAPDARQLDQWLADLEGDDAGKAYVARNRLIRSPKQSLSRVRDRYDDVRKTGSEQVEKLVAALDGPTFAERRKAADDLRKLGHIAVGPLEKALAANPALEMRKRIEGLLAELKALPVMPDQRLGIRCTEVLEQIGDAEAREVLARWARDVEEIRVRTAAAAATQRLAAKR